MTNNPRDLSNHAFDDSEIGNTMHQHNMLQNAARPTTTPQEQSAKNAHYPQEPTAQELVLVFTIAELEAMLGNAKAGGSVEVVITIGKELRLR